MAQETDFAVELEKAMDKWNTLKANLAAVEPNEPEIECECGRSKLAHLMDSILAVEALIGVFNGDTEQLAKQLMENGPTYLIFVVGQVFDFDEVLPVLEKIQESLMPSPPTSHPLFRPLNPFGPIDQNWN